MCIRDSDSPLARHEVHDLAELNRYTEVLHDDFQLPGEEGSSLRWQVNENRRVHVYERCSQFSILQMCIRDRNRPLPPPCPP